MFHIPGLAVVLLAGCSGLSFAGQSDASSSSGLPVIGAALGATLGAFSGPFVFGEEDGEEEAWTDDDTCEEVICN